MRLDLNRALTDRLVTPLSDAGGNPLFTDAQQFASSLATAAGKSLADVNVNYDSVADRFGFHVIVSGYSLPAITTPLVLNIDVSPLTGFQPGTNGTITLTPRSIRWSSTCCWI